ncbi:MAG: polysaccharide pyruvyl transferase family protein [Acetivibrio sp.]
MKKVLMRAMMSPDAEKSAFEVISKNLIGNNAGNMIYANSIFRTILTEDTQIDTIATNQVFPQSEIDRMNEEYDYFIIPLANAFRTSFISELKLLTKLVTSLKIPCIIAGVGIQVSLDLGVNRKFSFDETVKNFIDAVLEKSSIVGIRGETTGAYLNKLGYVEEKDYTIIGCPSMYMFGKNLPKARVGGLTSESAVSINYKIDLPLSLHELINRSMEQLPNFHFIPQSIEELRLLYGGIPYPVEKHKVVPETYPVKISSEIYRQDKVLGFVNVESWLNFLKGADFSFGSRIHGNIAAVLAGTPCYIFAYDSRICELASYHNIPFMQVKEITQQTNIFDIYEKTDFTSVQKGHEERFLHFLDFLNKNKIPHIYDKKGNITKVPFETRMEGVRTEEPVHSFSSIGIEEQEERLDLYYRYFRNQCWSLKKERNNLLEEMEKKEESEEEKIIEEKITEEKKIGKVKKLLDKLGI